MRGEGRVFRRGEQFWIDYSVRGQRFREPAGETEPQAKRKLKNRLKEIHGDRFVGPSEERLTVEQIADNLITHLKTRGAKAVDSFESHLKPVRAAFALIRAVDVTTTRIEQFIGERQAAKKKPATINREMGTLRQAFNLARKQGRLSRGPYFPMLREDNARQGFFERADFEAVAAKLPEHIAEIARFAYATGWRKGEILPLTWEAIDRGTREIRLATSKNGHGRSLSYPEGSDLAKLIERRWKAREFKTRDGQTTISGYVFHHLGEPVVDFRKVWAKACRKAGVVQACESCDGVPAPENAGKKCRRCEGHGVLPGRLFHDLRRSGVRDMTRAGVPESVAMAISGHKTASMFLRYNITSGDDKREALKLTDAYRATQPTERNVSDIGGKQQQA